MHTETPADAVQRVFLKRERGSAKFGLVGEGANHETNNGAGRDGCQYGVPTIIIVDPVIAVRRIIETPIIIVAYDDRIGVIAIMASDIIARHIVAIIHVSERWPRVIVEWTVSTPIRGAR